MKGRVRRRKWIRKNPYGCKCPDHFCDGRLDRVWERGKKARVRCDYCGKSQVLNWDGDLNAWTGVEEYWSSRYDCSSGRLVDA